MHHVSVARQRIHRHRALAYMEQNSKETGYSNTNPDEVGQHMEIMKARSGKARPHKVPDEVALTELEKGITTKWPSVGSSANVNLHGNCTAVHIPYTSIIDTQLQQEVEMDNEIITLRLSFVHWDIQKNSNI